MRSLKYSAFGLTGFLAAYFVNLWFLEFRIRCDEHTVRREQNILVDAFQKDRLALLRS